MYPIHQTAPGPNYMKPVVINGVSQMTNNPIPENTIFETNYNGVTVKFRVNMNFYTDPNFVVVEVIESQSKIPPMPKMK